MDSSGDGLGRAMAEHYSRETAEKAKKTADDLEKRVADLERIVGILVRHATGRVN